MENLNVVLEILMSMKAVRKRKITPTRNLIKNYFCLIDFLSPFSTEKINASENPIFFALLS